MAATRHRMGVQMEGSQSLEGWGISEFSMFGLEQFLLKGMEISGTGSGVLTEHHEVVLLAAAWP